eukprot:snap_masked-scaffold_11-processed-gene-6.13-mRNA-1 protein AED:1.00 eAED:1.00 QI:0/0/0/0/1/1/2/0/127
MGEMIESFPGVISLQVAEFDTILIFFPLDIIELFLNIGWGRRRTSFAALILGCRLYRVSAATAISIPRYMKVLAPLIVPSSVSNAVSNGMLLQEKLCSAATTAIWPLLLQTSAVQDPRDCILCPTMT